MSKNTQDDVPTKRAEAARGEAVPAASDATRKTKQRKTALEERKRAVRACVQCRRLKEKCEGGVPCRRCTHSRRKCEFESIASQASDLGLRFSTSRTSNAYAKELLDRSMYMEQILKHKFKVVSLDTESLKCMADELTGGGTNTPEEEADELVIEELCTIDPVEDTTTHYSGEFSYWNFSMRLKKEIEERMLEPGASHNPGPVEFPEYWRAEQLHSGSNIILTAIGSCPPRQVADFLVQTFFNFAETHYFYIDKAWFVDKLDLVYRDPTAFTIKNAATISIVLMVFAIGTQYAYLDSRNQNQGMNAAPGFSEDEVGTMFYQQAVRLLPEIIEASSLESVQACLLFGVYGLPIDASGLGYAYVSLAIRLAMQNGMHRKYTGNILSPVMVETRNQVWWSAYALERKICIFHGRPLSMLRSDVDLDMPKARAGDAAKSSTDWNISHMAASIRLTYSLEDYLNELSLLKNCQKPEIPTIMSRLLAKKNALGKWWGELPDECLNSEVLEPQAQFRSIMHLRLEYCLIRLFVGRPFLFDGHSKQSNFNSPGESNENQNTTSPTAGMTNTPGKKRPSTRSVFVKDCIEAARTALETCRSLRDTGRGLARASYIEYSSCRVSLLVLIAHACQENSDEFRNLLQDGLDMIKEMSTSGDSARSEVSLIEALERALARLQVSDSPSNPSSAHHISSSMTSGYDIFKHWETMWKSSGAADLLKEGAGTTGPQTTIQNTSNPLPSEHQLLDHSFNDWSTDSVTQHVHNDLFGHPNGMNHYDPVSDLAFFGAGDIHFSSNGTPFPEAPNLDDVLSFTNYNFGPAADDGTGNNSIPGHGYNFFNG